MAKLRVDFYESGEGETTVITFPRGGVGVVDAHPSPSQSRPDILNVLQDREIHFVCLTHPHADHGRDLVPVMQNHPAIAEFWHTNSDISAFIYRLQEMPNWPSEVREFAREVASGWANFLIDLYGAVVDREVPIHQITAGQEPRVYDGVEVFSLSPEEAIQQEFLQFWLDRAGDPTSDRPDPNLLSAILAVRFGTSVLLLGADGLRRNWRTAVDRYRLLKLPKALVLKVPHHGAANAFPTSTHSREANYLDICLNADNGGSTVLFAGDQNHPHEAVYKRLISRTNVHCLINGRCGLRQSDPLGIQLEGAKPVRYIDPCQPVVSFELNDRGKVTVLAGECCTTCRFASSA